LLSHGRGAEHIDVRERVLVVLSDVSAVDKVGHVLEALLASEPASVGEFPAELIFDTVVSEAQHTEREAARGYDHTREAIEAFASHREGRREGGRGDVVRRGAGECESEGREDEKWGGELRG
jgi:hypothetical protein